MLSTVVNVIALCLILIPVLMMYYKNHTTDFNTIKKDEISKVSGTIEEETVAEETTMKIGTKIKTRNISEGSMDLLRALQLYNTSRKGVSQVTGQVEWKLAYQLQGKERELRLDEASFERAVALLRQVPEFTIAAVLYQDIGNAGTIVAFSHGNIGYLELQSSGRKNEIRLHYVSRRDGLPHSEVFPLHLADGQWHMVALSISSSQVELLIDCRRSSKRLLKYGPLDTNFTLPQLQLWVGQRTARHFHFQGALQDVRLISGPHGYLTQCPKLDAPCPTCGQFSILQNTVEQLMHNLNELTRRLAVAEGRISKVEECECQKSCRTPNGTVHADGTTWEKGCQQCSCVHGEIECRPMQCNATDCKNPIIPEGECCPICLKQCLMHKKIYDHGVTISPKYCVECQCYDGSFTCHRNDPEECPTLPCPPSEQISVADKCCKYCPGVDYCAKSHKCHANASCLNLQTTYACHCDNGFQGDGLNCHDVDECKQQGGSDGHHCNANTQCLNTVGSYTCECLPGYNRVDKFNCAELDECAIDKHMCDRHATCINTVGSYYCICKEGYNGDGYTCKPVCNRTCQNGGECIAPGKCSCRRGYIGDNCELDLDECASDLHKCDETSTCANMIGWYYCRCKSGYKSVLHDTIEGTQCVDVDECNEEMIATRHTCHPSAKCINTKGSYKCVCPPMQDVEKPEEECKLSCWFEGREVNNSDTVLLGRDACKRCTCQDGIITCKDPICDCSLPKSRKNVCCPQCNPAASCKHQEFHHLVFKSGDQWIYQCQTCECLNGEIDCWQMECPPVTCSNPVTEAGDCCPRCEDDPCAREVSTNGTSLTVPNHPQPCSYAGVIHDSGSSWQDPYDKCTTCECKDGQLCCSYDYGCTDDLGNGKQQHSAIGVPESLIHHLSYTTESSLGDDTSETTLSTITTSTISSNSRTTIVTTAASTTSPVLSPLHSSSSSISNGNYHDLRENYADSRTPITSREQPSDDSDVKSQQQTLSITGQQQSIRNDSTTSSTVSERLSSPSATTIGTSSAVSSVSGSTLSQHQSTNTVDCRGSGIASSSSSSSSSSPTLATGMASPTLDESDQSSSGTAAQSHQLVSRRRKDNKKFVVLDGAT